MEMVPKHLMGRVQNTYYFFGTILQIALALAVGSVAHNFSLVSAFAILACVYGLSFVASSWPVNQAVADEVAAEGASFYIDLGPTRVPYRDLCDRGIPNRGQLTSFTVILFHS
jgi:hypothetical protein